VRVGVLLLACVCACKSSSAGAKPGEEAFTEQWLLRDCYVGEKDGAEAALLARGSAVEPAFRAALGGPSAALLSRVEDEALREYDDLQDLLKDPAGVGLSPDQALLLKGVSREQYARMESERLALLWQAGAIRALGLVGTPASLAALGKISKTPGPLRGDAEDAMARIRERFPRAP
jgi:hypothetical protein